ncbi:hypothetical protein HNR19_002657 [Nocardioides thalensis]|uniref:MOSC domain-containing protein n=1 Tax=Nocardioides thalensis TaxID=1914755 RepID=A0A853C3T2_9ACTN|nr:MOSC domain-containing protein [Nocardioides thalensis]NYJ01959.1 hypothetical protein [Nocardioides thalensis]
MAQHLPQRTYAELTDYLDVLRSAPRDTGTLELVVRRPGPGTREVLEEGELTLADGLIGDSWLSRATSRSIEAGRHLDAQLNVMSARMASFLAFGDPVRQAGAGDQLYLDLDLSTGNLPTGTRLAIGATAVIEVTAKPHNGCAKFTRRFGEDAERFVNSPEGKALRLRGFNARVVEPGTVRPGDSVKRL